MVRDTEGGTYNDDESVGSLLGTASVACCCFLLLFAINAALPVTQLVIGILYKDSCPMNYFIPIYLIVAGIAGLAAAIVYMSLVSIFSDSYFDHKIDSL
jgi:hypothetical protein